MLLCRRRTYVQRQTLLKRSCHIETARFYYKHMCGYMSTWVCAAICACMYTCMRIYIYTIIYIYMHKYIYIAHHCCPFVGRPLGLGTERERLQRRTVCRQRLQKTASTRPAPLCVLCQRSSCWSDVKPPILPLEPRIYEPSLSRALCSSQRVNTTTHSRRDAHIIFIHLCREARRVKTPIVVLRQC